jgi:hypothetical protein
MKKSLLVFLLFIFLFGCTTLSHEIREPSPFPLPLVTEEMEQSRFWTEKLSTPDALIMTEDEILMFNRENLDKEVYLRDVFAIADVLSAEEIKEEIIPLLEWVESKPFFGHDGFPLTEGFYRQIQALIDLESSSGEIRVSWGLVVRETNLRVLPTIEMGMNEESDYQFDYFQMSILSVGTPFASIRETRGGQWHFIITPYASGWVHAADVGISKHKEEVSDYITRTPFLVVTGPRIVVYTGMGDKKRYLTKLRLGVRIPLLHEDEDFFRVSIPVRDTDGTLAFHRGYIEKPALLSRGYLPYTAENVIKVSFSMIGERYGWGGMWEQWDCSAFVRDVFSTFGFVLPRNSTSQSRVGASLGKFTEETLTHDKHAIIEGAHPGITLLRLPGHVMIYVGSHENKHYVIHESWAYRTRDRWGRSKLMGIGRVTVSELTLGRGGKRGSLIQRITDVVEIRGYGSGE